MGMRGYQKYDMYVMDDTVFTWASTDYTHASLGTGVTIPTGIGAADYTSEEVIDPGDTTDQTFTKTFIVPSVFDALTILDGTISGTIKLASVLLDELAASGDTLEITDAELTIRAIDSAGSARTIEAKQTIWTGSVASQGGSGGQGVVVSQQIVYFVNVEDAILYANERIVLDFTITYDTVDLLVNNEFSARIYCTAGTDETTVTLPFVM